MKALRTAQRVADERERQRAQALAARERRVRECEAKLEELENYEASYAREFTRRATDGMGGAGLREYQAFLSRLAEAVQQQREIVRRARAERDSDRTDWQQAAQRAEIVDRVVKRREREEVRAQDRKEQRESDERAQRRPTRNLDVGT
jgi:flagellar protein FliJ